MNELHRILGFFTLGYLAPILALGAPSLAAPAPKAPEARYAVTSGKLPARSVASVPAPTDKLVLSEDEWRKRLTAEEFAVLRRHHTERPGTGCFLGTKKPGTYVCAGCGNPVFEAGGKFESGTGWASFTKPIRAGALLNVADHSAGMVRTEVRCARCDGHLGHVFDDGPPPTGKRYCINSVAMKHVPLGQTIKLVDR